MLDIRRASATDLPQLRQFYETVGAGILPDNFEQFARPQDIAPGLSVFTLVAHDGDRMVALLGVFEVPLAVEGRVEIARWPINFFALPELKGKGIGTQLVNEMRRGAQWSLVIGSTKAAQAVFDRMGFKVVGQMASFRWFTPSLKLARAGDRFGNGTRTAPPDRVTLDGGRLVAVRQRSAPAPAPWAVATASEIGAIRTTDYLRFAFFGALRTLHAVYSVSDAGEPVGFFVLSPQAGRPLLLSIDITDLDAVEGREEPVLRAAVGTARRCADIVRFRVFGERLARAARSIPTAKEDVESQVRVLREQGDLPDHARHWRMTFGDDDQFRERPSSLRWP